MDSYAFANARALQRDRLDTLATLFDAGTIRHLEALGVGPGSRCLEVGAGSGSIALWLSERAGSVLATDLDTTVLDDLSRPNLTVKVHDVLTDELPEAEFDGIHLRLVLAWLGEPLRALHSLVRALKPGGWLLAEEMDFVSVVPDARMPEDAARAFRRVVAAHDVVLAAENRFDPYYGRSVAGDLGAAGLIDVGCEGRASIYRGGEAGGTVWRLTLVQLRDAMIARDLVTAEEVDGVIAHTRDPTFASVSPLVMAAWGRRH